jgi:hypothetical protein
MVLWLREYDSEEFVVKWVSMNERMRRKELYVRVYEVGVFASGFLSGG